MPELCLFGAPMLAPGECGRRLPAERPFQLIALLASRTGWVSRDACATLFWPERDRGRAHSNLRFVLLQARRVAHAAQDLQVQAGALRWSGDSDARRFEHAIAERRWADALGEYQAPFLDGYERGAPAAYAQWLQRERARLHGLWLGAVAQRLSELQHAPEDCLAQASRALQVDALDETALSHLLRCLCALNRQSEARVAYQAYVVRLRDELAVDPSTALRELAKALDCSEAVIRGPRRAGASDAAAAPCGMVGRRDELRRIDELLRGADCRLLTITGPGGIGKSRLAAAAMANSRRLFADGGHWIALADLHSCARLAQRCAEAVGLARLGADSARKQLLAHLRSLRALLVFDNAEHLSDLAPWLDELLAPGAAVKALVTSRIRLGLLQEWLLPVDGLPVPDPDETEVEVLRAFDAVRLFELRAQRVLPDFDAAAQAREVAALVRHVDGLPLAIELAAAWVRLLPVHEIRREIERSLDTLGDAGSGRAYSVRDSQEHSWRLLEPAERRAMMRLAVCRGAVSREAAHALAEVGLPVLAALVDKSLLRAATDGRFGFHPLVQMFAREKLAQSAADALAQAQQRHAEHFLGLLARHNAFHAIDQTAALAAIGADFDNLLAAWDWALDAGRFDLIGDGASALESYLDSIGRPEFGFELFSRAAARLGEGRPEQQTARCHLQLARAAFCYRRGDYATGEPAARAALRAAQRAKYRFGIQSSTNTLGLMLWRSGRSREAALCLRDVLRRARADGDEAAIPLYALNLGRVEFELGNDELGEALITDALSECTRLHNQLGLQAALSELCSLQLDRGRPHEVLALAQQGLMLCAASGLRRNAHHFKLLLSQAHGQLGDAPAARRHAQHALQAAVAAGEQTFEPVCRLQLFRIALQGGERAQALLELQAAGRLAATQPSAALQAAVVLGFAQLCRAEGLAARAQALARLAASHPPGNRRERAALAAELAAAPGPGDGPLPTLIDALDALQGYARPAPEPIPERPSSDP